MPFRHSIWIEHGSKNYLPLLILLQKYEQREKADSKWTE